MSTVITTLFSISVLAFLFWNVALKSKGKELFPIKPLFIASFVLSLGLIYFFGWELVVLTILYLILILTDIHKNGWGFLIGFLLINWPILYAVPFLISYFSNHRGGDVQIQLIDINETIFMTTLVLSIILAFVRVFSKRKS